MDELSLLCMATNLIPKDATCRTCVHRVRFALNQYSSRAIQYCLLQKSKRSNSEYKTIKLTDKACFAYKKKD